MNEMTLKFNNYLIEIDETNNILYSLILDGVKVNQNISIIVYYIDDSVNCWSEKPLFTVISFDNGTCEIIYHYSDIEVYNDIYNVLNINNLIERII